jgi:hypothetical protein
MNNESNLADCRKQYEPPRVTTISLRPEEAVLGSCKTFNSGGPGNSTCFPFCHSVGS